MSRAGTWVYMCKLCRCQFEAVDVASQRMATGRPVYSPCCGEVAFSLRPAGDAGWWQAFAAIWGSIAVHVVARAAAGIQPPRASVSQ